jgi:PQQ enzyme repeat
VFATVDDTPSYGTSLYALNARTGATLWGPVQLGTYDWSGLTYDSDRVFTVNYDA